MMIDAHHHLWKYSAAEYGWITPQMPAIKRDFLPEHLEELMHFFGIEGTVAVQARQTLEETAWLLELAGRHPLIRGVVGWVPLTEGAGVMRHLERFARNRKLRGVRHVVQPRIKDRILAPWDRNMREMAKRQNVYCKLSGMITEADPKGWTPEGLQPYIDVVLGAFGPKRLMYGSDWPVMLLAGDYARWFGTVSNAIGKLSKAEQERIMGGTAAEAYGL